MKYTLSFEVRTLAWMPFWWFNTLSWTVQDEYGYVVDFGWGRKKAAYADGNHALLKAYRSEERPAPYGLSGGLNWPS